MFKMSSEVIKCPTIGAASFDQSPYIARHLPVRVVVGHNIDRHIKLAELTSVAMTSRIDRPGKAGLKLDCTSVNWALSKIMK